jgi:cytoskeletal protein RodZ
MKRAVLLGSLGALWLAQAANAQSPTPQPRPANAPSSTAPSPTSPTAQARPDAKYPNPSGQDSQPSKTAPKQATGSLPDNGTVESRGSKTANQSKQAQGVVKQGGYKGNTGKKGDPGTACSTARPTPNGGVDCGTGGSGATPGKVPK